MFENQQWNKNLLIFEDIINGIYDKVTILDGHDKWDGSKLHTRTCEHKLIIDTFETGDDKQSDWYEQTNIQIFVFGYYFDKKKN